jgi:hypothetical protein
MLPNMGNKNGPYPRYADTMFYAAKKPQVRKAYKGVLQMKKSTLVMAGMTALALSFIPALIGCTTTIPISYTEPARLDMGGVKRIAIDADGSKVTSYVSQQLTATGKYTVGTEEELKAWEYWKELAARQAPAVEVGAADLVGVYQANAVRADASYLEKPVKTSGVVKEIGKSSRGRYFARLDVGRDSIDIYFDPLEINKLALVEKGQTITVFGTCLGFNAPNMEDTAEILRILGAGRSVNLVDATFPVGEYTGPLDAVLSVVTSVSSQPDSHVVTRNGKDQAGRPTQVQVTYYDLTVTTKVDYQVLRAQNYSLIGEGTKSASHKWSDRDRSKLDPSTLAAELINEPLQAMVGEMIPTQRSISLTLEKEKTDKQAKKEMGEADKLVKAKDYKAAAEAYGSIYGRYQNFAAGYNQALLTEVADGVEAAVVLMEALSNATGNSTAQNALAGMQQRMTANQKSAEQLSE